jgi:fluoride exporter
VIDLRVLLTVGLGAAIGGIFRLIITQAVVARAGAGYGHYATLFINVSGSFLIGVVIEIAQTRADVSPLWRYFLATGVLGGYTTFSTFSFEALTLASGGLLWSALGYVGGSVVLGIGGAILGVVSARLLAAI